MVWTLYSLAGALTGCGTEGVEAASRAVLVIQEVVTFPAGQVGQVQEQSIRISNGGDGVLEVFSFDVDGPQGVFEVDGLEDLTLEPQEDGILTFRYTGFTAEQANGRLEIDSNGDAQSEDSDITVVRINIAEPVPQLVISPSPVDFGRVAAGTTASRDVSLINRGSIPVSITEVFPLDPSGEFTVDVADLEALPYALAPNATWVVTVNYEPRNDNRDQTPMEVEYRVDGDNRPRKEEVILQANGAAPCIAVTHEEGFDFGPSRPQVLRSETFSITNCSSGDNAQSLEIVSWGLLNTPERPSSSLFQLVRVPEEPLVLPPGEGEETFRVVYSPTQLGVLDRAWLEIVSNDSAKSPLVIELTGIGGDTSCPVPVIECSVRGQSGEPSDMLTAPMMGTVDCTSTVTTDPLADGDVEYRWSLERPGLSSAELESSEPGATSFFVDSVGGYVVQLTVVDSVGVESCEPGRAEITVQPEQDLFVELTWTLADGTVPSGEADTPRADVDLHLLHVGRGCWNSTPWDCNWRNAAPDWGVAGSTADNPELQNDLTAGGTVEQVAIESPEVTTYRIGVEYYADFGAGTVFATVRVYVFGSLVTAFTKELSAEKEFWEVADVSWPEALVTELDGVYSGIGEATCP
jgi:hypothetical protein